MVDLLGADPSLAAYEAAFLADRRQILIKPSSLRRVEGKRIANHVIYETLITWKSDNQTLQAPLETVGHGSGKWDRTTVVGVKDRCTTIVLYRHIHCYFS